MRKIVFAVPDSYEGVSVRGFLRGYCGVSARQMAKLKRLPGGIERNGRHVVATDLLHAGDKICLSFSDDPKLPVPAPIPLRIVYEDENILVADKPSGMPMYPSPGHDRDSLANAVAQNQVKEKDFFAYRPVYRLDKDTTGLVLIAKNPFAASCLSGSVQKTYFAVCEGPLRGSGTINRPIGLKPGHTVQRAVVPGGKPAVTRWRAISAGRTYSLVAVRLKTGRTHQIRVHFSACGHPLAGDDMYGGNLLDIQRQALHCAEIRFLHPVSQKRMRLRCALPADMLGLVRRLGAEDE